MGLIEAAIPIFFLLIGLELLASWWMGRPVYRLNDTIADLSCGIFQQVFGVAFRLVLLGLYIAIVNHASAQALLGAPAWPTGAAFRAADNALGFLPAWGVLGTWFFAFLAYDLAYYWAHRKMHEINLGWATHVVHHSSEEYNLAVALRQSTFQIFFSIPFYAPLALLGIPWPVFTVVAALSLLYQFWIHTRLVGKLGPLEWVFNTPSHHRVHHGKDPKYVDKNHAATLIIWDRLFGTFQPEEEEPVYGTVKPLNSWNPAWANLQNFYHLARQAHQTRNWRDALRTWFREPGWRPGYLGGPIEPAEIDRRRARKYEVRLTRGLRCYGLLQFGLIIPLTLFLLKNVDALSWGQAFTLGFAVVLSLTSLGGVLERQRWSFFVELARMATLLVLSIAAFWSSAIGAWLSLAGLLAGLGLGAGLLRLRHAFDRTQQAAPEAMPLQQEPEAS